MRATHVIDRVPYLTRTMRPFEIDSYEHLDRLLGRTDFLAEVNAELADDDLVLLEGWRTRDGYNMAHKLLDGDCEALVMLDSDHIHPPKLVEHLATVAAANPDVGWVQPPTALTVDNEAPDLTSAVANKEGTKITATFQAGEILGRGGDAENLGRAQHRHDVHPGAGIDPADELLDGLGRRAGGFDASRAGKISCHDRDAPWSGLQEDCCDALEPSSALTASLLNLR